MRAILTLWAVLILSTVHGVSYYINTGHVDIMTLVFFVISVIGLMAEE